MPFDGKKLKCLDIYITLCWIKAGVNIITSGPFFEKRKSKIFTFLLKLESHLLTFEICTVYDKKPNTYLGSAQFGQNKNAGQSGVNKNCN